MARVVVEVMPKPEILDPQGKAITGSLRRLGHKGFSVRQGKRFEIEMADAVTADMLREINQFAETLLANTVIETFKISVEDPSAIVEIDPIEELYEESVQLREKKAAEAAATQEESIALIEAIDNGELMREAARMVKEATGEQPAVKDEPADSAEAPETAENAADKPAEEAPAEAEANEAAANEAESAVSEESAENSQESEGEHTQAEHSDENSEHTEAEHSENAEAGNPDVGNAEVGNSEAEHTEAEQSEQQEDK